MRPDLILAPLSGALLCNALPHLVAGLQGEAFPTPFATPRGCGNSPAWLNFAWGFANLAVAVVISLRRRAHLGETADTLLVLAGMAMAGGLLSYTFAKHRPRGA